MRKGSTSFGEGEVQCWRWLFGNKTPVSLPRGGGQFAHTPYRRALGPVWDLLAEVSSDFPGWREVVVFAN